METEEELRSQSVAYERVMRGFMSVNTKQRIDCSHEYEAAVRISQGDFS